MNWSAAAADWGETSTLGWLRRRILPEAEAFGACLGMRQKGMCKSTWQAAATCPVPCDAMCRRFCCCSWPTPKLIEERNTQTLPGGCCCCRCSAGGGGGNGAFAGGETAFMSYEPLARGSVLFLFLILSRRNLCTALRVVPCPSR